MIYIQNTIALSIAHPIITVRMFDSATPQLQMHIHSQIIQWNHLNTK